MLVLMPAKTECNFDQALAQARELDESFARTGQLSGPVHGVPISVKDQLNITGLDSSIGFSK
jgi:amidase